jgi:thymidine kinase
MQVIRDKTGWIEVICGPMFSGKSEELIRRIRRAEIARQRLQIFKHAIDARYDSTSIVSHNQQRLPSVAIEHSQDILRLIDDKAEVVAIDEGQFFDDGLVSVCNRLANLGKRVTVAGLDLDYRGLPFGPMPSLMAAAEYVTKQLAICMVCGNPANFTQRLTANRDQIVVGAQGTYEARCRRHFEPPDEDDGVAVSKPRLEDAPVPEDIPDR